MDLDKLIVGRRYKFTALKRGEQFIVEGTFKGLNRFWWPASPIEDDVVTKMIVIKTDDEPLSWSLYANRVTNIERLD
jgi:hypothetical protein